MLLVVGLGNPGAKYAKNRHNIGFMVVDELVRRYGFSPWRSKFQGQLCLGDVGGAKVLALKPMTFMNESGRAVTQAAHFYKILPQDVLVFHDELDLAGGKVRCKVGGGHAGHNGLRSIQAHIGPDFRRLRMGIGHPGNKSQVTGYVLEDFSKDEERAWVEELLDAVCKHFPLLAKGRESDFMSKVASATQPPRPKVKAGKMEKEG